jgi:hypothetical protein
VVNGSIGTCISNQTPPKKLKEARPKNRTVFTQVSFSSGKSQNRRKGSPPFEIRIAPSFIATDAESADNLPRHQLITQTTWRTPANKVRNVAPLFCLVLSCVPLFPFSPDSPLHSPASPRLQ